MILGDLNCRTGIENDFIDSQLSNTFVTAPDIDGINIDDIVCEHIHRQRKSDDQMMNENGKKLLNISKNDNCLLLMVELLIYTYLNSASLLAIQLAVKV